jgi:hypothetical protein
MFHGTLYPNPACKSIKAEALKMGLSFYLIGTVDNHGSLDGWGF